MLNDASSGSHIAPRSIDKTRDTVVAAPTPDYEEKKAREQVEGRTRRNKKQGPEEGKAGKQDEFVLRPIYDAIGREVISLGAATLRDIGKQDMERPTDQARRDHTPALGPEDGQDFRSLCKQVQTELVEGLGNTYAFHMARKESWLTGSQSHTSLVLYVLL